MRKFEKNNAFLSEIGDNMFKLPSRFTAMAGVKGGYRAARVTRLGLKKTAGMEVPMFGSFGITEWVAASITLWLAAQLPLGMLVGSYLRRAAALHTIGAVESPAYVQRNRRWQEFLQIPAAPRAL